MCVQNDAEFCQKTACKGHKPERLETQSISFHLY